MCSTCLEGLFINYLLYWQFWVWHRVVVLYTGLSTFQNVLLPLPYCVVPVRASQYWAKKEESISYFLFSCHGTPSIQHWFCLLWLQLNNKNVTHVLFKIIFYKLNRTKTAAAKRTTTQSVHRKSLLLLFVVCICVQTCNDDEKLASRHCNGWLWRKTESSSFSFLPRTRSSCMRLVVRRPVVELFLILSKGVV